MKPVIKPQATPALVDKQGLLTLEGHLMLLSMYEALIEAQQTIADHEARIVALEP